MFGRIKQLFFTDLVKVSGITAISTFTKLISTFISAKVLATVTGPDGVALLGQLSNGGMIMYTLASAAINIGVTKYVAQYHYDPHKQQTLINTSFKVTLICSFIVTALVFIFSKQIGYYLFKNYTYTSIIQLLAFFITFYAVNNLLLSILNGFKQYKLFVKANICISILNLSITVTLILFFKTYGALLAFCISQSLVLIITLLVLRKQVWLKQIKIKPINWTILKSLGAYSLMSVMSIILSTLSQLLVRERLIQAFGKTLTQAGIWEGMNKISSAYTMIIIASVSVAYLPRLAELKSYKEVHQEVITTYKIIMPFLLLSAFVIYLSRNYLILILYSRGFTSMNELFIYQLAGDVIRIAGWLIGYVMLARSYIRVFVILEIIFNALFVILSFTLINKIGIKGAVMGYLFNYILYFLACVIFYKQVIWKKVQLSL